MAESRVRRLLADGRFLLAVLGAAALLAFLGPLAAYDLWWHLKAGRAIIQSGSVPHTDVYSFTAAGRPWTFHSWLAGVALAEVWAAAGATGVVLFRAIMMTASVMVAWALARRRGVGAGLATVLALPACLQLKVLALARPFLFSFLLFTVFAYLLHSAATSAAPEGGRPRARRYLWGPGGRLALLAPLTLLWANLHAGFLAGILLLGAYGAGEMASVLAERSGRPYLRLLVREGEGARFRAMFGVGVACLLASLVTPFGPDVLTYTFRLLGTVKLVGQIQEWRPTPFPGDYAVFWGLLGIETIAIARSAYFIIRDGRLRGEAGLFVTDVLLFAGFGLMAVRGVRHVAWVCLLAPSLLGYHFSVSTRLGETAGRRLAYGCAAVALAAVVALSPFTRGRVELFGIDESHVPVKACDFMAEDGLLYRPFNSYEWGGYLIYRFWPQMHVFCDGRTDLYGDEVLGQYLQVARAGEGWRDVLARYDVQMLVIDYRRNPARHFFEDRRWRCVYWDDVALVAMRDDVLSEGGQALTEFRLSNPAVFERSLEEAPAADILSELEAVLARDPQCWTALAYRARCLVRLAVEQPGQRQENLAQAAESARQALDLEGEQPAPWRATADVARAVGNEPLAAKAEAKAIKYAKNKS